MASSALVPYVAPARPMPTAPPLVTVVRRPEGPTLPAGTTSSRADASAAEPVARAGVRGPLAPGAAAVLANALIAYPPIPISAVPGSAQPAVRELPANARSIDTYA